jgi:hypothetical protein
MKGVTCKKGELKLILDISEFKEPELAYGMFTGNRDPRQPTEKIGAGGQVTPAKAVFVKGVYYVEVAAESQQDQSGLLRTVAGKLSEAIAGSGAPPQELTWFPAAGIQEGSPRLIPQSVLGLRMLSRGYLAQYESGKAFFVSEASPEAASALFGKLKQRFPPTGEAKAGEEAFLAEDRYLGKLCIFRKGRRVGGFANAKGDAAAEAAKLAGALP